MEVPWHEGGELLPIKLYQLATNFQYPTQAIMNKAKLQREPRREHTSISPRKLIKKKKTREHRTHKASFQRCYNNGYLGILMSDKTADHNKKIDSSPKLSLVLITQKRLVQFPIRDANEKKGVQAKKEIDPASSRPRPVVYLLSTRVLVITLTCGIRVYVSLIQRVSLNLHCATQTQKLSSFFRVPRELFSRCCWIKATFVQNFQCYKNFLLSFCLFFFLKYRLARIIQFTTDAIDARQTGNYGARRDVQLGLVEQRTAVNIHISAAAWERTNEWRV